MKRFNETLEVGANKGIKNVVVSLPHLQKGKKWGNPTFLEQKECRYTPHVVLSPVGVELTISNNDSIPHHIVTDSRRNLPIEKAQPPSDRNLKATFVRPETIKVACDIHRWMSGWLVIQPHPYYAVTDATGNFEMTEVPAGPYELRFWHETLGEITQRVSVKPNETVPVAVEMIQKRPGMTSPEVGKR